MNAISQRRFRPYDGERTGPWRRKLVIPRFALQEVLQSRLALIAFVAGFVFPVASAAIVYIRHNATVIELFGPAIVEAIPIGANFFQVFLVAQSWMTFILTLIIGPPLVARDMADDALPLFLSRPLSRADYVLGKMSVLLLPLSAITWVMLIVISLLQFGFEGSSWLRAEGNAVVATFLGFWTLLIPLALVTLALSALVQRRWVARGLMLGAVFVSRGLAEAINGVLDTRWGYLISPTKVLGGAWQTLYDNAGLLTMTGQRDVPGWSAWLMLALVCALSILVLSRRIRAYEEVRS